MPSGIIQRGGNKYDAVYEHPWGGQASNADDADIQPNQLVTAQGMFIKNGRLCTAGWAKSQAINFSDVATQNYFINEEILRVFTILDTNGDYQLCAISDFGRAYKYDNTTAKFVLDQTIAPPTANPVAYDIHVIAGVAYVTYYNTGTIYAYTPGVSFVLATDFVGGKYLMDLVGYLITANSNQPTDTPAVKRNRYNWSSPYGYTTWDPAIDRTAGFNTISDVEDQITGLFTMGNVGYVIRTQGLTQLSPTGVGTAPFDATPLWASEFGIGCSYPDTLAQYGNLAIWANDNNIYAFFSGNMPQAITGAAQSAIYADINSVEDSMTEYAIVSGAFFNCSENSNIPELCYVLCIVKGNYIGSLLTGIFWTYSIDSKAWTRQEINLLGKMRELLPNPNVTITMEKARVQGVLYTQSTPSNAVTNKRITGALCCYGSTRLQSAPFTSTVVSFFFPFFNSDLGETVVGGGDNSGLVAMFREEEIRLGTKPTVKGVIVKASGTGTLNVVVSGVQFTDIILNSVNPKVYFSYGEVTDVNPQLTINGNFEGTIIKANMAVVFAEGEPT